MRLYNRPMKFSFSFFASLLLSTAIHAQAPLTVPKSVITALEQVQPAAIKAHIAYLADDRLLGRQAGTPGYQMAVDYITQQLKMLGVQPAGDAGTFVQNVRLRRAFLKPGATFAAHDGQGATLPLTAGQATSCTPVPNCPPLLSLMRRWLSPVSASVRPNWATTTTLASM